MTSKDVIIYFKSKVKVNQLFRENDHKDIKNIIKILQKKFIEIEEKQAQEDIKKLEEFSREIKAFTAIRNTLIKQEINTADIDQILKTLQAEHQKLSTLLKKNHGVKVGKKTAVSDAKNPAPDKK